MKFRENFKLAYQNKPSYQVDKERKSVKCHLTCKIITPDSLFANKIMDNVVITANGYAKCDEQDNFDVNTGMKIALARAESLAYHKAKVLIMQCIKDIERFATAAFDFDEKSNFVRMHNDIYIKSNFGPWPPRRKREITPTQIEVELDNKQCEKHCDDKCNKPCCDKNKDCCENKCKPDNSGVIRLNVRRQYNG